MRGRPGSATNNFANTKFSQPQLGMLASHFVRTRISLRFSIPDADKAVCLLRPLKNHLSVVFYTRSAGIEPVTSRVTGECSNQLSYDRIFNSSNIAYFFSKSTLFVSGVGIEPTTAAL